MTEPKPKAKKSEKELEMEKRREIRIHLRARVDYDLLSDDTFLFEHTSNVSRGGIFLSTHNPLPVGTTLNLRFNLPDDHRTIKVTGKVVWINEIKPGKKNLNPGMGIEFVDLSEKDKEAITLLIKRKALLTD